MVVDPARKKWFFDWMMAEEGKEPIALPNLFGEMVGVPAVLLESKYRLLGENWTKSNIEIALHGFHPDRAGEVLGVPLANFLYNSLHTHYSGGAECLYNETGTVRLSGVKCKKQLQAATQFHKEHPFVPIDPLDYEREREEHVGNQMKAWDLKLVNKRAK